MSKKKLRPKKNNSTQRKQVSSRQNGITYEQAFGHYQNGRLQKAEECCRALLTSDKRHSDTLHLLGMIFHQSGKDQKAIDLINRAIAITPEKFFYHLNLGNIFFARNMYAKAETCYRKAMELNPDFIPTNNHLARTLAKTRQFEEAGVCYRKALALEPNHPEALTGLGNALLAAGMVEDSVAVLRKLVETVPDRAESHYNLGGALMNFGTTEEAAAEYREALRLQPDFVDAYHNLGLTHESFGQSKEAVDCYRKAIAIQPSYCLAHYQLSKATKHIGKDDEIAAMEKLFKSKSLTVWDRILLAHGLGKAYEDLKSYGEAFDYFEEANNLKRSTYEYCLADDDLYFKKIEKVFTKNLFERLSGAGTEEERIIFVLGMPRSGTSLVEQILASHPDVFGAGELDDLDNLLSVETKTPTGGSIDFETLINQTSIKALAGMGREYLGRTHRFFKDPQTKYIVDKMPHNFLYIGMIKLILPNAKIINCRRQSLDNCLSIYKNLFHADHKYACNQKELGEYYQLYRNLMKHWRGVLPGFIHEISYEELVADQEAQSRAIFEFCGIPWDSQCLDFHRTKRSVRTLSSSQVRRPIYRDSIRLWEKYGIRLKELADSLARQDD